MSDIKHRRIEPIPAAISSVFNSLLAVSDSFTTILRKLQGLLFVRNQRQVIVTAASGGASTTADVNITTLNIAANTMSIGDVFSVRVKGSMTKPNSGGSTIIFWVKIGVTKVIQLSFTPAGAITNLPFNLDVDVVIRTLGSTATLFMGGRVIIATSATANTTVISNGSVATFDSTIASSITAGFIFSNSNASNNITSNIAIIQQE